MHEGLHIIDLEGTPRERGRAHGEELRPLIQQGLQRWQEGIQRSIGAEPRLYIDRFLEATSFVPAIERWTPHLLDEVRGIGEGAGLRFDDALAYQLMDEEWLFRYDDARRVGQPLEHCSTVGVFGEGGAPTLLAQNMDLPGYYDGTQALLRLAAPGGLRSMVFTPAGLIGTTGLNSRGVGVCVNTLDQLGHRGNGLPVAFVMRGLLEAETLDDALAFVHAVDHASGQNYAIGGPDRIVDVECSARRVSVFAPMATRVYHTNHPLVNDDQPGRDAHATALVFGKGSATEAASASTAEAASVPPLSNSEQRFAYLERAMGDPALVSVETIMGLLRSCDVPISVPRRGDGAGMTLGSLVMELSAAPVLHIAPGPPAETAYTTFAF